MSVYGPIVADLEYLVFVVRLNVYVAAGCTV